MWLNKWRKWNDKWRKHNIRSFSVLLGIVIWSLEQMEPRGTREWWGSGSNFTPCPQLWKIRKVIYLFIYWFLSFFSVDTCPSPNQGTLPCLWKWLSLAQGQTSHLTLFGVQIKTHSGYLQRWSHLRLQFSAFPAKYSFEAHSTCTLGRTYLQHNLFLPRDT